MAESIVENVSAGVKTVYSDAKSAVQATQVDVVWPAIIATIISSMIFMIIIIVALKAATQQEKLFFVGGGIMATSLIWYILFSQLVKLFFMIDNPTAAGALVAADLATDVFNKK